MVRIPDSAVHRDKDSVVQSLARRYGTADVKDGVAAQESRWIESAGQHHGIAVSQIGQGEGGLNHRVGAVSDHKAMVGVLLNRLDNLLPVAVGKFERVFSHQRDQIHFNRHIKGLKDLHDLRVADLIITFGVEIDLIDGSAGGDKSDLHPRIITAGSRFLRVRPVFDPSGPAPGKPAS